MEVYAILGCWSKWAVSHIPVAGAGARCTRDHTPGLHAHELTAFSVAKWVEIDVNSGNIIDEIAVKEIDNAWIEAAKTDPNLPREVVVNRDLNTYDVAYIAYLRGYKYFPATDKARLYQQVYNLGSLETLISLYKIYGYYLPEWFVCRALLDLCESLRILDKPPPQDTKYNAWTGFGGKKPKYEDLRTIHLVRSRQHQLKIAANIYQGLETGEYVSG